MSRAVAMNATLEDVEKDGDILLLADGRRLAVSPDDATATSIWMHAARLTVRERRDKGKRAAFNLNVTNEETGETIAARLSGRSGETEGGEPGTVASSARRPVARRWRGR